jgi:outer membrane murein-binding lipoprotein Lpp
MKQLKSSLVLAALSMAVFAGCSSEPDYQMTTYSASSECQSLEGTVLVLERDDDQFTATLEWTSADGTSNDTVGVISGEVLTFNDVFFDAGEPLDFELDLVVTDFGYEGVATLESASGAETCSVEFGGFNP